ncbi:hypothetical protein Val02_33260 [Virgisporangium aliadipatigenens]|uniref:Beta-galactosidase n=1 Tax=Virgisporangium aliadipatigenens TaxID=741659 RepID=A0A8J3YM72_9ACTN|nr:AbfB domain-containing protein [Virgisporangium aliadipatigenens]GIJ46440.1 hypothetical protein Val02_33260 [Virgisporangium aliadipatigenens]
MSKHPLRTLLAAAVVAAGVLVPSDPVSAAPTWTPKTPPLTTPWTSEVSPTNALPEYPRPQLTRGEWQNLNGVWEFASAPNLNTPPFNRTLGEAVLVPYPIESALSGIQRHENNMWYKRTFALPANWTGRRINLNFGAVTWETRVWVNGLEIGRHTGGFDAFTFDITSALRPGNNELIVGVNSPVDAAKIPIGKQRLQPNGIWYTPASGIWQTVWIEPVNSAHITRLDTTPDVPSSALDLVVQAKAPAGQQVRAEVLSGGTVVGTATGAVGSHLRIPIPNQHLWEPADPFLYQLRVSLIGTGGGDTVGGYFGQRSVGKAMIGGVMRPTLNGKFVYQLGTLDQGYWPDGIYTAPTDEALASDLVRQKELGFNMVRKHIKVEPARWFYHADRLGLMVWQDMPALNNNDRDPPQYARTNFESELTRMINQLKGITSIVQWVPFNEGWGEYEAGRIADLVKNLDPTRLVNHNSGSNCCDSDPDPGNGDIIDDHWYQAPGNTRLPDANRVAVLGEYGGLGRRIEGHEWQPGAGFAYGALYPDEKSLTDRYVQITTQVKDLIHGRGLSASVYTEPYDLENEINGFYTYDRRILKMDANRVRAMHQAMFDTARGLGLSTGGMVALKVTTSGYTDRYLRHRDGAARTDVISNASPDQDRKDTTFWLRPGLSDSNCYSFEARTAAGSFLRHSGAQVVLAANDGSAQFAGDATFCVREGRAGGGSTFESANQPGTFLRHRNEQVYVEAPTGGAFDADATWAVQSPLWRSGTDLPLDQARSFQVTTPGYTDRYLRHQSALARTDVVNAGSDALLKADATFVVRRGLSDSSCYSFESKNFPGQYLRHANSRVRLNPNDNSQLFRDDATFCAFDGLSGVELRSINIAGTKVRHYAAEVWIAANGGSNAYDSPVSYAEDTSWGVVAPWAP